MFLVWVDLAATLQVKLRYKKTQTEKQPGLGEESWAEFRSTLVIHWAHCIFSHHPQNAFPSVIFTSFYEMFVLNLFYFEWHL